MNSFPSHFDASFWFGLVGFFIAFVTVPRSLRHIFQWFSQAIQMISYEEMKLHSFIALVAMIRAASANHGDERNEGMNRTLVTFVAKNKFFFIMSLVTNFAGDVKRQRKKWNRLCDHSFSIMKRRQVEERFKDRLSDNMRLGLWRT